MMIKENIEEDLVVVTEVVLEETISEGTIEAAINLLDIMMEMMIMKGHSKLIAIMVESKEWRDLQYPLEQSREEWDSEVEVLEEAPDNFMEADHNSPEKEMNLEKRE